MTTIGDLCKRYLAEYPKCPAWKLQVLTKMQTFTLASKKAPGKPKDYIAHCTERRVKFSPATAKLDIIAVRSVLSHAKPAWEMADVTDQPIREAWPILKSEGLIGNSRRRTRIPSAEETAQIVAYFKARGSALWADLTEFQDASSRRIGETQRIEWGGLDQAAKTVLITAMKHPRRKRGNDKRVALPDAAFAIIMRQPRLTNDPQERIFKFSTPAFVTAYGRACDALGLHDLQLRDSRRGTTTRLLDEGRSVQDVMLVTGHDDPTMPLTTYNALRAERFHRSLA